MRERVLIVGAGPIGLACAISAARRGLDPLVVDAGAIAESIVRYPVGMVFFTTPERLEIGGHPLVSAGPKATREEALKYYRGVVRAEGLRVRPYLRFRHAERSGAGFTCLLASRLGEQRLTAERIVLATGYFGQPNLLGIPGETLPHVSHYADEAHRNAGLSVVIVGGKNSAVEHALACFRAGARVTLVYRRAELRPSVKYWLRPDLENRISAGEITARFDTRVSEISAEAVTTAGPQGAESIAADRVFLLTGFQPDFALFRALGISLDAEERPRFDPETHESNVPGLHLAGSITCGRKISEVFIENGRYDGERIFGDTASRTRASRLLDGQLRPVGE